MASTGRVRDGSATLTPGDFVAMANARAGMYEFLTLLCSKPAAEIVGSLMKQSTSLIPGGTTPMELRDALDEFRSSSPDLTADGEQALQVDWTRLFRGVAKGYSPPPPYEGVYKEGLFGGPVSKAVAREYAVNGVGLAAKSKELSDYIGVELKFMSTLASEESKAWNTDPAKALKLIGDERRFVQQHVHAWIPRFCGEAKKLAKTRFYSSVTDVIRSVIDWDFQLIESIEETASGIVGGDETA